MTSDKPVPCRCGREPVENGASDGETMYSCHNCRVFVTGLENWSALMAPRAEPEALSASEALYGFMGWLTCREQESIFGATHDASLAVQLIGHFCDVQGLPDPREGWEKNLVSTPALSAAVNRPPAPAGAVEIPEPDKINHPDVDGGDGTVFKPCSRCGASIWFDDSEPVICAECAAFLRGIAYARAHARVAGAGAGEER